jgi:hypothetical protein
MRPVAVSQFCFDAPFVLRDSNRTGAAQRAHDNVHSKRVQENRRSRTGKAEQELFLPLSPFRGEGVGG